MNLLSIILGILLIGWIFYLMAPETKYIKTRKEDSDFNRKNWML